MAKSKYSYQVRNPMDDSVVLASDYDYDTADAAETAGKTAYDEWAAKTNLSPVSVYASDGSPVKEPPPPQPPTEPNE